MLWTAETAPSRMFFPLKDLQSRLNMLPSVEIKEPDDLMLQTLVVKLFNDRQILISPDVLTYIVNNAPRSFEYIEKLVESNILIMFLGYIVMCALIYLICCIIDTIYKYTMSPYYSAVEKFVTKDIRIEK